MKTDRLASLLLVLFGIAFIGQAAFYLPRLPEQMASHFDMAGQPNGWMSRIHFALFTAVMLIALYLVFGAMPMLLAKLPHWMINLPRKDYWFAPERKAEAVAYLRSWLRWFGCFTLLMLLLVFDLVYRANLFDVPKLHPSAVWIIVMYLVLVVAFLVPALMRFRVPRHHR